MAERHRWLLRVVVGGALSVAAVQGSGRLVELWRFGGSDDAAFAKVKQHVEQTFAGMVTSLESIASSLAAQPDVIAGIGGHPNLLPRLFEVTRAAPEGQGLTDVAVTVYGDGATARAWTGRPSEIPPDRILGGRDFLVAPGPLGLRLVYIEPILDRSDPGDRRRLGSVAAERVLSPATGVTDTPSGAFRLAAPIAVVALRAHYEGIGARPGPRTFELRSPSGEVLLEATVSNADLQAARGLWRHTVWNLTLILTALVIVLATAPGMIRAGRATTARESLGLAAIAAIGLGAASALLRIASAPAPARASLFSPETYASIRLPALLRSPADLLIMGALAVCLGLVMAGLLERIRVMWRRSRGVSSAVDVPRFLLVHTLGGILLAVILFGLHELTEDTASGAAVDLLHTSLYPWDSGRVGLLAGLLLAAVGSVWGAVIVLAATHLPWRHARQDPGATALAIAAWAVPGVLLIVERGMPLLSSVLLLGGCVVATLSLPSVRPWVRHASHASRMLALFAALLFPTLLIYPVLWHHANESKRRFVEAQYAQQAARHPEELQTRLTASLAQIDQIPELQRMASPALGRLPGRPDTDRAFFVWRQTDFAQARLTSAIELYGANGALISRFALNFPEYADVPQNWLVSSCDWEVFGEAAPFGSKERRVLHAERAICDAGESSPAIGGSVVVHLALDYQALPFISSQNPYVELLRETPSPRAEGRAGQDVELVIYGWGLQPVFTSGQSAWSLDDTLFERIYASREPFWTTRSKSGRDYEVFIVNNRAGIYALGYPVFGVFDHFVRLAETTALVGLVFLGFATITMVITSLTPNRFRFGRALLREVRTSYYRRLFLAFVAATVIPVLALALVIRNYFTTQLRAEVETEAARTAIVAQRVIEEGFGLQTGEESTAVINDDLLVFISQVIDQDVNIFEGSQLLATSERDLFASGLLPTRTPDGVYAAIALAHMPSYVAEDAIGSLRYLVAAAPIRAAGRDAILTVPLASRQREIESQIADLDRGILLGVTLFVLLGAGGGFYMAERIADPVKRLTRATRQIARGNFDAQVVVKSADELQQLVAAFNRMAIDLKDQQLRLERTHRLEAWAEMARQVAHEIKNPLTPVQLSAEHLLRVHRDRGDPLSPVLESCVDSILTQVRILRRISSEFSSYASSPAVHKEPTDLRILVHDVLEPYLVGLAGRIAITVDIPDTLPSLFVDRRLVSRALTNVIENALHAMPGEGALRVRATGSTTAVVLALADTGVGVDEVTLRRIFEPYFSTKVSGTGLGMAIAKRNVELSDGTIAVESEKGRGTTVTMTFQCPRAASGL